MKHKIVPLMKNVYQEPLSEIIEVRTEGIICASKDGYDEEEF